MDKKEKKLTFSEIRKASKMSQKKFSLYFGIPRSTIEFWDMGRRTPPQYLLELIQYKLKKEKLWDE